MSQKTLPIPEPPPQKPRCRYCDEELSMNARVCRYCSRSQNRLINLLRHSDLISIGLFITALWQFNVAIQERADAQVALGKAISAEARISEAKKDILDVTEAVLEIAQVIPRSTGYGSGLSDPDRIKLKKHFDYLNSKLHQFKQSQQ